MATPAKAPTKIPTRKASEMWQRMRAAREFGKKTQAHIAEHIGTVSRGAVAQWEASTEDLRTTPSAVQVLEFSRACGVPVEWLLDDTQRADALHSYMQTRSAASAPAPIALQDIAAARAFWKAVEFGVIMRKSELADRFNVPIKLDGIEMAAPFLDGKRLVAFSAFSLDWRTVLVREVGQLLLIEKAYGHGECDKSVYLWAQVETHASKEMLSFAKRLQCTVALFSDFETAAKAVAKA